jgi:hypothetical protein
MYIFAVHIPVVTIIAVNVVADVVVVVVNVDEPSTSS